MEKEKPEKKKKKKSREDRQLHLILGTMVGLIVVFLVAYSIFQSLNTFEYQGLTFKKDRFGQIPVFHYYYFTGPGPITGSAINSEPKLINLYFRHDPRTNNVPINKEIEFFPKTRTLYISTNTTGLTQCEYSAVGLSTLTSFLSQNGFNVKGATPEEAEGNERYMTCETRPDRNVILIQEGTETEITRQDNCYIIDVANCEILPAVEKFMVQTIVDAKLRQSSSQIVITHTPGQQQEQ